MKKPGLNWAMGGVCSELIGPALQGTAWDDFMVLAPSFHCLVASWAGLWVPQLLGLFPLEVSSLCLWLLAENLEREDGKTQPGAALPPSLPEEAALLQPE